MKTRFRFTRNQFDSLGTISNHVFIITLSHCYLHWFVYKNNKQYVFTFKIWKHDYESAAVCVCVFYSFSCSRWVWTLKAGWSTGLGKRCGLDGRKMWTERCWFPKRTTKKRINPGTHGQLSYSRGPHTLALCLLIFTQIKSQIVWQLLQLDYVPLHSKVPQAPRCCPGHRTTSRSCSDKLRGHQHWTEQRWLLPHGLWERGCPIHSGCC